MAPSCCICPSQDITLESSSPCLSPMSHQFLNTPPPPLLSPSLPSPPPRTVVLNPGYISGSPVYLQSTSAQASPSNLACASVFNKIPQVMKVFRPGLREATDFDLFLLESTFNPWGQNRHPCRARKGIENEGGSGGGKLGSPRLLKERLKIQNSE